MMITQKRIKTVFTLAAMMLALLTLTTNAEHPTVNIITPDMVTWSGEPVELVADSVPESNTGFTWSASPSNGVVFNPGPNVKSPIVTITIGANMTTYTVTVGFGGDSSSMEIDVYPNACMAIRIGAGWTQPFDLNGDCIIDIKDFALLAATWLIGADLEDLAEMSRSWLQDYSAVAPFERW